MKYLYLLILVFFLACDGKPDIYGDPDMPELLLSQEKFTNILMETQLLEATLKLKLIRKDDIQQRIPGYYEEVFEKFEVSEQAFRQSFDYYREQPVLLAEIFDSVEVRLIRYKDAMESGDLESDSKESKDDADTLGRKPKRSSLLDPQYKK